MDLETFMTEIIDKIDCLASLSIRRCKFLKEKNSCDDVKDRYAKILGLCRKMQKNVDIFEQELSEGIKIFKHSNDICEEQQKDIRISIRTGINVENIELPSIGIDLQQFQTDLKQFVQNYSKKTNQENVTENTILPVQDQAGPSNREQSVDFNDTSWTNSLDAAITEMCKDDSETASDDANLTQIYVNPKDETKLDSLVANSTAPNGASVLEKMDITEISEVETSAVKDETAVSQEIDIVENALEILDNENSISKEESSISQMMELVENPLQISEGLSKEDNYDATKRIQNELMYVTAEVPYESEETPVKKKKSAEKSKENCNETVDELLDWYNKDDSSIDSDSSESSGGTVMYSEPEINEILAETEAKKDNVLDKIQLKECYVKLERKQIIRVTYNTDDERYSSDSTTSSDSGDDKAIDNLCNFSNLENPRKRKINASDKKRKVKRRRKKITNDSGSETSDLSGFESLSDREISTLQEEDVKIQQVDPNELLTQIIADLTHTTDDAYSSVDEGETSRKKCAKKENNIQKLDTKEKRDKDDWRNDPLLNQRFDDKEKSGKTKENGKKPNTDNDDSDVFHRKKQGAKPKMQWLNESSSSSEFSDSETSDSDVIIEEKRDSDCEITGFSGAVPFDVKQESENDKLRGRKNILSVLSNESLDVETQRAGKEEEERVMRLEKRLQLKLSQSQEYIPEGLVLDTTKDGYEVRVDQALIKRAYEHQIEGLKFMWNACYENVDNLKNMNGTGCILAHSMGLGKTFQVFMLVHTLFRHEITGTKHVLIVCPLSTVSGWFKEFQNGIKIARDYKNIQIFTMECSDTSDIKHKRVFGWKDKGGVLILGYEAYEKLSNPKMKDVNKCEKLREALVNPGPNLVVCDEGHLLKNGKTLRTKALMQIRTKRRIALTGTPLQNNLTEYYHMVQFVKPNLLGTQREFKRQFANPIMNGQYEDSSEFDIQLMKKRSHVLHRLLKNTVQRYESNILKQYLRSMQDYALFIQLHPLQEKLYKKYIEMVRTKRQPIKKIKTFFKDYQVAKFICSHPFLLYTMETQNGKKKIVETDTISIEPEVQEVEGVPPDWWKSECPENVKMSLQFGTKLLVMMGIIEEAEKIKEKVLIFTSSLVELNSIEYFLKLKGTSECPSWKSKQDYFRMDGTVPPHRRTQMCDLFNSTTNPKLRVFLMSHKVGGLGLNLIAANRVILLGANFNPSHDLQSIYRAYRFGQEKPVYIYRLLSMGTMEEKIYNRCVSKLAIASRVVDKHQIARHYKNLDLDDLYTINVDLSLRRATPAKPNDDLLSNVLLKHECIYKYHHHEKLLENRPDEDLNEEDKIKAWEEFKSLSIRENSVVQPAQNPLLPSGPKKNSAILSVPNPLLHVGFKKTPLGASVPSTSTASTIREVLEARVDQIYSLGRKSPYDANIMADIQKYVS